MGGIVTDEEGEGGGWPRRREVFGGVGKRREDQKVGATYELAPASYTRPAAVGLAPVQEL